MPCSLFIRGDVRFDFKTGETPGSVLSFSPVATKLSAVPGRAPSGLGFGEGSKSSPLYSCSWRSHLKRQFSFMVLHVRPWLSSQTAVFSGVGVDSGLSTGWLIQSDQCLQLHIFQWDQSQTPVTAWATQFNCSEELCIPEGLQGPYMQGNCLP